jgi:hypothetical protein
MFALRLSLIVLALEVSCSYGQDAATPERRSKRLVEVDRLLEFLDGESLKCSTSVSDNAHLLEWKVDEGKVTTKDGATFEGIQLREEAIQAELNDMSEKAFLPSNMERVFREKMGETARDGIAPVFKSDGELYEIDSFDRRNVLMLLGGHIVLYRIAEQKAEICWSRNVSYDLLLLGYNDNPLSIWEACTWLSAAKGDGGDAASQTFVNLARVDEGSICLLVHARGRIAVYILSATGGRLASVLDARHDARNRHILIAGENEKARERILRAVKEHGRGAFDTENQLLILIRDRQLWIFVRQPNGIGVYELVGLEKLQYVARIEESK